MVSLGYGSIPWVAEMEFSLTNMRLYDTFTAAIEKDQGRPWTKIREEPQLVRSAMAKALHSVDPKAWPNLELAAKAIEDIEKSLNVNPRWLAKRLAAEARRLDPERGRIVLLLDEVGLYIGRAEESHDRLGELQALAENLSRDEMLGLVWLVVTAQEALEEVVPELERRSGEFQRLRDRFRLKFTLTTENIEEVVRVRLLEKRDGALLEKLKRKFQEAHGALTTYACVHNVSRDKSYYGEVSQDAFIQFYPLMPHHVRLIQEILNVLRGKGIGEHGYTGRERALLGVVQTVLCNGVTESPIGRLVTFDSVFDAIEEELQLLRGQQAGEIRAMAKLGEHNGLSVQSVAKALYLLQHAGPWFLTSPENVAAVLHTHLGADGQRILQGVQEGLQELVKAHFVGEREGQFRFLSQTERTFEQEVERARGRSEVVGASKKRQRLHEIAREAFRELGQLKFREIRSLDVKLIVDDEELKSKGHVALEVFSPLASETVSLGDLETRTASNGDLVVVVSEKLAEFEDQLERSLAMEYVIGEKKRSGLPEEELRRIQEKELDLDILKNDKLLETFRRSVSSGHIVSQGESRPISNGDWRSQIRQALAQCAESIFPEFKHAAAVVKESDIEKVLQHRGGSLPRVVIQLKVYDEDGTIREDSPLVSRILRELMRREESGEPTDGSNLIGYFDGPPNGWEGRAVRLGVAALFKHGPVWARLAGSEYHSVTEPGAKRVFLDSRSFNKTEFQVGEVPSQKQRRRVSQLAAKLFKKPGLETLEEIGECLSLGLDQYAGEAERLSSRLQDLGIGDPASLAELSQLCKDIASRGIASARILGFLKAVEESALDEELEKLIDLMEFEVRGNLDKSVEALNLAKVAEELDPKQASEIRRLLGASNFVEKWSILYDEHQKLHSSYVKRYKEAHERAQDLASKASADIGDFQKDNPNLQFQKQDLELPWSCQAEDPKTTPPSYVCQTCGTSLGVLERVRPQIEHWKTGLLEMGERQKLKKAKNIPKILPLDEKVESPKDLERFEVKVRAFVREALERKKKVRVSGEVRSE
jgi:hypothetical protein